MVNIPFALSDWRRTVAGEPYLRMVNRYFEQTPASGEQTTLLARPSLKFWKEIGPGPIKGIFSQPGSFNDALFAVSGEELWRIRKDNSQTFIASGILNGNPQGFVSMAATAAIGSGTPEYLYIADGNVLWLYMENGFALGVLTASGAIANGDQLRIGTMYYQWTNGSVDAGTPDGTSANPWLVALGATNTDALDNMRLAVNNLGTPGVNYSSVTTENPDVLARSSTALTLRVQARQAGPIGNGIITTETGANISWSAGTLTGGGTDYLTTVDLPDDLDALFVAFIAGYIIVVPGTQTSGFKGRFFWIEPGETFIDPLNFATAERSPDPINGCRVIGDQLWLFGTQTTETWYPTGNFDAPFVRTQGQVFEQGIIEGTDVPIRDTVAVVDNNGAVFLITGQGPKRLSTPAIEERIRLALKASAIT